MRQLTSAALILWMMGCSHNVANTEPSDLQNAELPAAKNGQKTIAISEQEKAELIRYIVRLSDPEAEFTEKDRAFLAKIPKNPPAGSFYEAAAAIGTIRQSIQDGSQTAPQFVEQDAQKNAATPNAAPQAAASLETTATEKSLDLSRALEKNVIIKNYHVYRLAMDALNQTKNSDEFRTKITSVIRTEAEHWSSLLPAAPTAATETKEAQPSTAADLPAPSSHVSPADARTGDILLSEADQLADDGQFKEAIEKMSSLDKADPFFPSAKEKIKTISNRAVMILRQKAAQAFQNALPTNNPADKANYLSQAKVLLEEALKDYPEADQLGTVRDNLAVITRDLERIQSNK